MNYIKNGNWVRYQNGNYFVSINLDNGTKIRETINPDATEFVADFPESADVKITNRCTNPLGYTNLTDKEIKCGKGNCNFCHEGSGPCGKHSDALHSHVWDTFHPYTELALGGGNVLEYPDLIPLLERFKSLHLIPNITVHQTHFMENLPLLHKLVDKKLIYGLGISMNDVNKEGFIEAVKEFPNAVLHVINGIVGIEQLKKLANNNLKILILGYKDVRRGKILRSIPMMRVENEKKQKELYDALPEIIAKKWFDVVSFDNLAIKQLNPKGRFVSNEDWETIYMGDDGLEGEQTSASMYIDLVENEFARNSCDVDHRMPVGNMSVKEMYKILCKM